MSATSCNAPRVVFFRFFLFLPPAVAAPLSLLSIEKQEKNQEKMSLLPQFAKLAARRFSASAVAASAAASGSTPARKVAVLGAAGGIGQPLGLLMKVRRKQGERAEGVIVSGRAAAAAVAMPQTKGRRSGRRRTLYLFDFSLKTEGIPDATIGELCAPFAARNREITRRQGRGRIKNHGHCRLERNDRARHSPPAAYPSFLKTPTHFPWMPTGAST